MTSRDRVLIALNHEEPDRVPIQVDFTPEIAEKLAEMRGAMGSLARPQAAENIAAALLGLAGKR